MLEEAFAVLKRNDLGASTKPSPSLYPHQWSWDSAFIAIGLAHRDTSRSLLELETLFAAQWTDGRVPHIVFNPKSSDYFPGPERWQCSKLSKLAPRGPETSGIIQPPVHALAVKTLFDTANGGAHEEQLLERVEALFPKLMNWHRYLATARDPEKMGLITIYHPWESGCDNSPRWDSALANVKVGAVPPYVRRDLAHVADPSERPSKEEYDRFLWLVECLKTANYDDTVLHKTYPFMVKDTLMSAIFVLANDALHTLAKALKRPETELSEIHHWQTLFREGVLEHCFDPGKGLSFDLDVIAGCKRSVVSTCAGLSPLLMPGLDQKLVDSLVQKMQGPDFAGHPNFKYAVIPSTTPDTKGFHPRAYWRGPSWPVISWLFWYALKQKGCTVAADALKKSNLDLLSAPGSRFGEYFELEKGEQLGSPDQSWTAAVVIDWLLSK